MENILFECQECNVLSSQSGFCINGHTLIPVHYVKKEDHLIEVTRLKARLDTNRAQVEALKQVEKDFQILLSICDCFDFINPDAEQVEKVKEMLVKYVG